MEERISRHPRVVKYARLPDNMSVYTAELTAIKHALMWIKKKKYSQSVFLSDSLSSIQLLQGCQSTRPDIIGAIQIELKEIERHNLTVTFEWLSAHMGIMGNETADAGAKAALVIANKDMLTYVPLGINEVMSKARRHCINKWQEDWDQTPNIWHYNIKPTVNSERPGCKNPLSDKIISKLRLGASHQLNAQKYRIQNGSEDCKCDTLEDMKHYLLDCTLHESQKSYAGTLHQRKPCHCHNT